MKYRSAKDARGISKLIKDMPTNASAYVSVNKKKTMPIQDWNRTSTPPKKENVSNKSELQKRSVNEKKK